MNKFRLQVIVPALNKRRRIPPPEGDPDGIAGVVLEQFNFIGEEATPAEMQNRVNGKWYKDRDGYFYSGKGLLIIEEVIVPPARAVAAMLEEVTVVKKDWGFVDFKIDELWKFSKGENISVAILDSGLNFNLADFKNKTNISYFNAVTHSNQKLDCLDSDQTSHGTDCTAMLCAQGLTLWGVAPEVSLLVIKITAANGERLIDAVFDGLAKAIEQRCDIISMSFSYSQSSITPAQMMTMTGLIQQASALNLTIVAAAGDSGDLSFPVDDFPASFQECLSIGGITQSRVRSTSSTRSTLLDLMGPGEKLISLANPGKLISGTSFSTPFVAGVIALLKSIAKARGKLLTNPQIHDILIRSADKQILNYNSEEYGFGIVDPPSALKLI